MQWLFCLFMLLCLYTACSDSSVPDEKTIENGFNYSREFSLFQAISQQDTDYAKELLENGADPDKRPEHTGFLPLEIAETPAMVSLLLSYGANPNLADRAGDTSLHHAVFKEEALPVIRLLVKAGADVNKKGRNEFTPLHLAVQRYIEHPDKKTSVEIIRFLAQAGADLNSQDEIGYTVLMTAVVNDRPGLVELLLALGADRTIKDKSGSGALDYAGSLKVSKEVLELLRSEGPD